jgi:hypothetical protein
MPSSAPQVPAEQKPVVKFITVQITSGPGRTHLEHFPGGATLCGLDMFPAERGPSEGPGFCRRGGQGYCPRWARRPRLRRVRPQIEATRTALVAWHWAKVNQRPGLPAVVFERGGTDGC